MSKIKIIYKSRDIAVVEKPYGTLSQRDVKGEDGLVEMLSRQLNTAVYPVHRLDRNVGGVMVFALTKRAAAQLSVENAFEKTYLAVATGVSDGFADTGEMTDYLFKDGAKGKSFVVKGERKGAKLARLAYEILSTVETEQGRLTLFKIRLFTGRTHQIRVQLSSRGMPLVGDGKYGSRIKSESIALWSNKIKLNAPVNAEKSVFEALPSENEWFKLFI